MKGVSTGGVCVELRSIRGDAQKGVSTGRGDVKFFQK